jgi:hypothetical protein
MISGIRDITHRVQIERVVFHRNQQLRRSSGDPSRCGEWPAADVVEHPLQ